MDGGLDNNYVPVVDLPQNGRAEGIRIGFSNFFGKLPDFYVRVPGRVNLIGEHVDYCGYWVCPMALEQDILLAVSVEDDEILKLHNLDPEFKDFECDIRKFETAAGDGAGAPRWHQYFLCGVRGVTETLAAEGAPPARGMRVAASGAVPRSAGLASSSALVCAAALAAARANHYELSKEKLANICAKSERYVGTQGGGMDQAIAFLATEGCAKLIHFNPLRSEDVVLPGDASFVIAHSVTNLNKAATSDYNQRVVECRLAAQIIAKTKGLKWIGVQRLGDLQKLLELDLPQMIRLTEDVLNREIYTKEDVVAKLDTTKEDLEETVLTKNTKNMEKFKLRQRALHVFQEALRVEQFCEACRAQSSPSVLGALMNASHDSLRDLYECSHPQLDRLVEMSRPHTWGSRLTGAGWGGCTVSLVSSDKVDAYVAFLKEHFYRPLGVTTGLDAVVFATRPMGGACLYR